jgi:hypothetical protein
MGFTTILENTPLELTPMMNGRQSVARVHFQSNWMEEKELPTVTGTRSVSNTRL